MHPANRALVVVRRWHHQHILRWLAGLRREEARRLQHLVFDAWWHGVGPYGPAISTDSSIAGPH
jgi:hypothetical protein